MKLYYCESRLSQKNDKLRGLSEKFQAVTLETKFTKYKSRRASYEKMAESFPDFEIQEIQELKEKSEKQNAEKSTSTWLNSGPAGPKKRNLKPISSPTKRNK